MEYSGELLELVVTEFGWTAGTRFIVERGVEAALFEAIQPVVDGLAVPSVFGLNIGWRDSFEILASSGEPFDRLWIGLVRELLADSTFREVGNLVPFLGHIGDCLAVVSRLPAHGSGTAILRQANREQGARWPLPRERPRYRGPNIPIKDPVARVRDYYPDIFHFDTKFPISPYKIVHQCINRVIDHHYILHMQQAT